MERHRVAERVRKGCKTCRWFAVCVVGGAPGAWYKCARCAAHWRFEHVTHYDGFLGKPRELYSIHGANTGLKAHRDWVGGLVGIMEKCPTCYTKADAVDTTPFNNLSGVIWEIGAVGAVLCGRFNINVFGESMSGSYDVVKIL